MVIPETVTVIPIGMCDECYELKQVVIPASVVTVEYSSFRRCDQLVTVICKAVTPPDITHFWAGGDDAFYCHEQATLYVPEQSVDDYSAHERWGRFQNIVGFHVNIPGDVNGDGEVNIADANSVIVIIINGGSSGHGHAPGDDDGTLTGDINGDGEVNIADLNAIVDMILSGQ